MLEAIQTNNFTMEQELALIKYKKAVDAASLQDLRDLFMSLLHLKLGRDLFFIAQFKKDISLSVPKIGNSGYSIPLEQAADGDTSHLT